MKNIIRILYILFGFFSTSELLAIPRGGGEPLHVFSLLLVPVILDLLFIPGKKALYNSPIVSRYYIWTGFGVVSSLFGLLYFSEPVMTNYFTWDLNYLTRIVLYAIIFFLLLRRDDNIRWSGILLGLFSGMILNVVVSIIDSSIFYITGTSFVRIFLSFSGQETISRTIILNEGGIRSTAFTSDPATVAMYAVILTAYGWYQKKYTYGLLSFVCALATLSATTIAGVFLVSIIHIKNFKDFLKIVTVFVLGIILIFLIDHPVINNMRHFMLERMEYKIEIGDGIRSLYWERFPEAVINTPTSLFIGTGYYTASDAYRKVMPEWLEKGFAFDPEQTYFSYFFDIGLIGFCFWISMYWLLYKKLKRINTTVHKDKIQSLLLASVEGFLVVCLFYHYTIFSVQMLFLICCIIYQEQSTCNLITTKFIED